MKKVICSMAAIVVVAACGQPASAWINSQFGLGVNWNYASGGNSFLCGAFRNSQPGAPEMIRSCGATPVYPQQPYQAAPAQPCAAPAPVAAPTANTSVNTQSLRYSTYRPQSAAPTYPYPANYYRGY